MSGLQFFSGIMGGFYGITEEKRQKSTFNLGCKFILAAGLVGVPPLLAVLKDSNPTTSTIEHGIISALLASLIVYGIMFNLGNQSGRILYRLAL